MRILIAILLLMGLHALALAADDKPGDAQSQAAGWAWEFDPGERRYPEYLADPRRPRMMIGLAAADSEIPETSSGRVMVDAGGRYTIVQGGHDPTGQTVFAIDIEGGLFTQFDLINSTDFIGWDGRYALFAVYDCRDAFALRFGYRHISCHLGDEYMEASGRHRINYIRDDLALGFSYRFSDQLLAYIEPSWAWNMGNTDQQDRWACEGGVQYQGPFSHFKDNASLYTALHLRAFEENNWDPGISAQIGYLVNRGPGRNRVRLGLELYTGRSILGDFALAYDEKYAMLGIYIDF